MLQRELGRRLFLHAPPETGFFLRRLEDVRNRASRLHCLTALGRRHRRPTHVGQWFDMCVDWVPRIGIRGLFAALTSREHCANEWGRWLDGQAQARGLRGWVEKTPLHFYHLDLVRLVEPAPRIVFVVRDARDTVASIVDRARTYPERFGNQDIGYAISLWNDAIRIAMRESIAGSAICVRYEDFVADPEGLVATIGQQCGIPPGGGMPVSGIESFVTNVLPEEAWKGAATMSVKRQGSKWLTVLSAPERACAERSLDFDSLGKIVFLNGGH